jgi:hypothetical protein
MTMNVDADPGVVKKTERSKVSVGRDRRLSIPWCLRCSGKQNAFLSMRLSQSIE